MAFQPPHSAAAVEDSSSLAALDGPAMERLLLNGSGVVVSVPVANGSSDDGDVEYAAPAWVYFSAGAALAVIGVFGVGCNMAALLVYLADATVRKWSRANLCEKLAVILTTCVIYKRKENDILAVLQLRSVLVLL